MTAEGAEDRLERFVTGVAVAAFAALAVCVLYMVAGPLLGNDVWWHLAHGRAYLESGPWLAVDPCLGTAQQGPIPHDWGFAVAARVVELLAGLQGLRVVHALAAVGVVWLALGAFRREAGRTAPALLATAVFLVLSWYRLVQLRPQLMSMAGVLLLQRWLFAPTLPSWRQVGASVALVVVWANVHAAFMVGPLLIVAALAGVSVRFAAAKLANAGDAAGEQRRAVRLAAALGLGLVAALLNPRGWDQHLSYLASARTGAIQLVADEWARFSPFAHTNVAPAVSALTWVVTDALLGVFLGLSLVCAWRFLRRPSAARLEDGDPVRMALSLAALVAMLAAIRFLWLGIFPLVFLLHVGRHARRATGRAVLRLDLAAATGTAAIALAFPAFGGLHDVAVLLPGTLRGWLAEAHTGHRFFTNGVRFLKETGVRGQLFHDYALGGYLCYELGPSLRTFVDGSMNYPDDVARDYGHMVLAKGTRPGETFDEALARRGVDVFFGFGVPVGGRAPYTTAALEGHPDWILVSRSWRHGIYLRRSPANRENLSRITAWYAAQGIDFDPERGFDPGRALLEHRAWADAWGLWPAGWSDLIGRAQTSSGTQVGALETLGLGFALVGAYPEQIANDRRAAALRPRAKAPRRRLIFGLLHQGRPLQALAQARDLVALDPDDPRSRVFARAVGQFSRARSPDARSAAIDALPLLSSRQPLRQ